MKMRLSHSLGAEFGSCCSDSSSPDPGLCPWNGS